MGWLDRFAKRTARTDPDRATEADIRAAYRLFLRREPDPGGLSHHVERVRGGLSLDELIRSFSNSDEFHLRKQAEQAADEAAVDLGGYQVVVRKHDPDFGSNIFHWRAYEEPVRRLLKEHLEPGDVCVDVGANVGVMTFLAASAVGPQGRVIAVEPNPDNVQLLYRGIVLNGCTNVDVLALAASDRRSVCSLTGRSNTRVIAAPGNDTQGPLAQTVPLDEALAGLTRLDFVKMDIEGHEPLALQGFLKSITRHRPTLLVEFNPRCLALQRQSPLEYLEQIFRIHPRVRAISHFNDDRLFERSADLMEFWRRRSAEVTAQGLLPEGLLHFDLLATTERVPAA